MTHIAIASQQNTEEREGYGDEIHPDRHAFARVGRPIA
jgi:hypothetical protein